MSRFAVGEQKPLVWIEDELPEFVLYARLFGYFVHVKTMSELCPTESKTPSNRICDDGGYQQDQQAIGTDCRLIVDPNQEGNKKTT